MALIATNRFASLKWFAGEGAQAECFAYADSQDPPCQAFIKWQKGYFACFTKWIGAFFPYMRDVRPANKRHLATPQLLCMAREDHPQQFYLDIEWYREHEDDENAETAMRRVRDCLRVLTDYWDDHHPHYPRQVPEFVDEEEEIDQCDYEPHITMCSRDTGMPWDPVGETGGYKHSYHICVRCTGQCYFAHFADLKDFSDQFKAFLERNQVRFPQLWYGRGDKKTCAIDQTVYTKNRAMRLPLNAKKDNDPHVFKHVGMPILPEQYVWHVHAYIPPDHGWPYTVNEAPVDPARPHAARGRARHDPALGPSPRAVAMRRILEQLDRAELVLAADDKTLQHVTISDALLEDIVGNPLRYTPTVKANWARYGDWSLMIKILLQLHPDKDAAYRLWLFFADQVQRIATDTGRLDDPVSNWRRWDQWMRTRQAITGHQYNVTHRAMIRQLLTRFELPHDERFFHTDGSRCLVTPHAIHPSCNMALRDMANSDAIVVHCHHCHADRFFGYLTYEQEAHIFDVRYVNTFEPLIREIELRPTHTNRRTVVVPAQMGTGKTALLDLLRRTVTRRPDTRILILGMRVLLTHDMHKRLSGGADPVLPGLVHYQKHRRDLGAQKQVVLQLDSLLKILHGNTFPQYDVVVLEEIESLLSHLSSSTLSDKRRLIGDALLSVVRRAALVLVLDADIGARGYEFLERARPDIRPSIYRNLATPLARTHELWHSVLMWSSLMLQKAADRVPFFVVSNSKRAIGVLEKLIRSRVPDCRILVYTSATDNAVKRSVSDCNTEWLNYDVVMYSPVISAGLNFDPHLVYFHCGFVYVVDVSSGAREVCQQIGRPRRLIDNRVYVHLKRTVNPDNVATYTTIDGLKESVQEDVHRLQRLAPEIRETLQVDIDEGTINVDAEDSLNRTLLHNVTERYRSQHDFIKEYKHYCLLHGDKVERGPDYTADDISVSREELSQLGEEVVDEFNRELADSQRPGDILEAIADVVDGNDNVSPLSIMKDRMCTILGARDIRDPEIVDVMNKPDYMPKLAAFMVGMHPDQARAMSVLRMAPFDQHVRVPYSHENNQVREYAVFVRNLQLFQGGMIDHDHIETRTTASRDLVNCIGLHPTIPYSTSPRLAVVQGYETWYNTLDDPTKRTVRALCKDIDFNAPVNARQIGKRVNSILRKLTGGLNVYVQRGMFRLDLDVYNRWASMASMVDRSYMWMFPLLGSQPEWFRDTLAPE